MREVSEVSEKDPGADPRRLSNREKTLPADRLRPACSPGSMTCLPGIAPGVCFVKFLWAVSAFLLVRLSGCF